jgi:hypothetical protein
MSQEAAEPPPPPIVIADSWFEQAMTIGEDGEAKGIATEGGPAGCWVMDDGASADNGEAEAEAVRPTACILCPVCAGAVFGCCLWALSWSTTTDDTRRSPLAVLVCSVFAFATASRISRLAVLLRLRRVGRRSVSK